MLITVLKEAWISISAYKMRTFLTMLGTMIGVAAVIIMVSMGQLAQNQIIDIFNSIGTNLIIIGPASTMQNGIRGARGKPSVTFDDVHSLKTIKDVEAATYAVNTAEQAVYGSNNYGVKVIGTSVDYAGVANWEIDTGRWFTEREQRAGRPCVIIGQTIIEELFGLQEPLGKTIRIKGKPFTVIGTLKSKGDNILGQDQDNVVIMPATTLQSRLKKSQRPNYADIVLVKTVSEDSMQLVAKKIEYQLRSRHRLKPDVKNDFSVRLMTDLIEKIGEIIFILTLLLVATASISLIVGSIGIMNIMLVSVTERTREIGIRKSLGATHRWIVTQFLTESLLISFLGSSFGLVLGIVISKIGGSVLGEVVPISPWSALIAFAVASIVGVVSGLMPAIKAMKLDPIEALRFQ